MAIDIYWGSGSPYSWRVLLALEYKKIPYRSHLLEFGKQEHKSPQMLRLNPRGRLPVLTDGEYVCYESLAIVAYLDRKYPEQPLFGASAEEAGAVMRVLSEYQSYVETDINSLTEWIFSQQLDGRMDKATQLMQRIASEIRNFERLLSKSTWLAGAVISAADIAVFPGIQLLLRALERREAQDLRAFFLPLDARFPSLAAWVRRIENLPGYDRTYPPHWRG
jgi:glutathione S-transferase